MSEVNDPIIQLIEEYFIRGDGRCPERIDEFGWIKGRKPAFRAVDTRWVHGNIGGDNGKRSIPKLLSGVLIGVPDGPWKKSI